MTYQRIAVENIIAVQPRRHKLKTNEYQPSGQLPIIDQGAEFIAGFTDQIDRAYDGPLPVVIFGDHTCCLKYVDFPFAVGADGTQVLRPSSGVDARYLYYALYTAELEQFGYQRHFKLLKDCEVSVPPLDTQRRIASILGSYDDLIEVNRRRVAVLEEMARGLFEEWFVRFRFPGHEAVPIHDTPDWPLPEGWRSVAFGDLLDASIGGLWGEAEPSDESINRVSVVRGTDFPKIKAGNFTSVPDRYVSSRELAGRLVKASDILLEASGGGKDQPVGRVIFLTDCLLQRLKPPVAPASFCRLVRAKSQPGLPEYVFCLLSQMYFDGRIEKFQKQSTGLRNLSMRQLCADKATLPSKEIVTDFGRCVRPWLEAVSLYRDHSYLLGASRDLLLPRLISGQLSVADAESELEDVA